MLLYDYYADRFPTPERRCSFAQTLTEVFETSILAKLTDQTTPDQFHALQHSLLLLYQRLEE
jgi:hypothetical protein